MPFFSHPHTLGPACLAHDRKSKEVEEREKRTHTNLALASPSRSHSFVLLELPLSEVPKRALTGGMDVWGFATEVGLVLDGQAFLGFAAGC